MGHLKASVMLAVVFLTGCAVLVLEVVATRLLSPYFGNTIYTVSSVLGVFLAALSFGYYFGGGLADRRPDARWFYGIIAASGLSTIALMIVAQQYLPLFGNRFSMVEGPPVVSTLLFFVPAFLLGMLSPYAIKLQAKNCPEIGIGRLSGQIFFFSTFGSIFGSIFAGFFLIPSFGVGTIVLSTGFGLVALGAAGLLVTQGGRLLAVKSACLGAILFGWGLWLPEPSQANSLLVRDGIYERLEVFERVENGKRARILKQNMSDSGGIYLDSDEHVSSYSRYFKLYQAFTPKLERALAIGGGPYTIPRVLLQENPDVKVDVVEIEPLLHELAKRYFELPADPRLTNYVEDGRRYLFDHDTQYDLMFMDVYLESVPVHFTTIEFFELAKKRIRPGGLFLANFIGSMARPNPSLLLSEARTFRAVFPNSYFLAADSPKSFNVQNFIIVGHNSDSPIDLNDPKITGSSEQIVREFPSRIVDFDRYNLDEHLILTDDYAPVEYLTAQLFVHTIPAPPERPTAPRRINAGAAWSSVRQQLSYGERSVGSPGHARLQRFIESESRTLADDVIRRPFSSNGQEHLNIVARFEPGRAERVAFLSGYSPEKGSQGACGAASGVATLLEVARYLSSSPEQARFGVDLIFMDGRDGKVSAGAREFAAALPEIYSAGDPQAIFVLGAIGDANLDLRAEQGAPAMAKELWSAGNLLTKSFNSEPRPAREGDHTPFTEAGLPVISVDDSDYSGATAATDTEDRCSLVSLDKVGSAIVNFIYGPLESRS